MAGGNAVTIRFSCHFRQVGKTTQEREREREKDRETGSAYISCGFSHVFSPVANLSSSAAAEAIAKWTRCGTHTLFVSCVGYFCNPREKVKVAPPPHTHTHELPRPALTANI